MLIIVKKDIVGMILPKIPQLFPVSLSSYFYRWKNCELLAPPEELIKEEQAQIKTLKEQVAEGKRAEKLAQQLREMGVNPDDID